MISFDNPQYLYLLIIIPMVLALHLLSLINFKKRTFKFANFETMKRLSEQKHIISKNIPQLLLRLLFILLIVGAISGMNIEITEQGYSEEVILAIDSSGSMLATDFEPNRIEATKEAITELISNISITNNIGIISFTSIAYLEQDSTDDKRELISKTAGLSVRKTSGTSLGTAINFATGIFGKREAKERALIIISDGQENLFSKEELTEAVGQAQSLGIKIHAIGVGSEKGAPIGNRSAGVSLLNQENLEEVTKPEGSMIIAKNKHEIVRALREILDIHEVKKRVNLSVIMYMVCFAVLLTEWYVINFLYRPFP